MRGSLTSPKFTFSVRSARVMADVKLVNATCLGTIIENKAQITDVFMHRHGFLQTESCTDGAVTNFFECAIMFANALHRVGTDFH